MANTSLQESLNVLAKEIAKSLTNTPTIVENKDGSIDVIIKQDANGDIGLTSESNEISVFGLGGHQHFGSSTYEYSEIVSQRSKLIHLLQGLIAGRIGNAEFFRGDNRGMGGCFEEVIDGIIPRNRIWKDSTRVEICIHKNAKYELFGDDPIMQRIV